MNWYEVDSGRRKEYYTNRKKTGSRDGERIDWERGMGDFSKNISIERSEEPNC